MRRLRKKGDLNLSINAIVVLILAITMLGLGLGFMRNMFSKTTAQFGEVSDTMKQQVVDDIESSGARLVFNNVDIKVKKGEKKDIYFGIKNDGAATVLFTINACTVPLGSTGVTAPVAMTAVASGTGLTTAAFKTFAQLSIPGNEVSVSKLRLEIPSTVSPTTYQCVMQVASGSPLTVYETKAYFVTVE